MAGPMTPTLGELPFDLTPRDLGERSARLLEAASRRLDELERGPAPAHPREYLERLDAVLLAAADLSTHAGLMFNTHPDAEVRNASRAASEAAERFFTVFRSRRALYDRLRGLDGSALDAESRHALDKMLLEMRRAGVELDDAGRAEIRALNDAIDALGNEFQENINRLTRTIELPGPHDLDGLPPDYVRAHPADAHGVVRITTQYPDAQPAMAYADTGSVRQKVQHEFLNVAYPENIPILQQVLAKRHEIARRLGYASFAEYATEDKMIGSAAAAQEFVAGLGALLEEPARRHVARLLSRKQKDDPSAKRLQPWDGGGMGGYYDLKLRREDFGVDLKRLREYLPYPSVRDGLFGLCERLFGVRITPAPDPGPLWHPSVDAYDVHRGEEFVGRFYLDLVPRDGKFNHAAQFTVRTGIRGAQLPQAALICNFLDPGTPKGEALMEYTNVVTFFHEFGHLVHALFSGHGRWLYNTQGFIERDFVEAPSQLFEEWARDPATLRQFAKKPGTGEPIPTELLERLKASEGLGRATGWSFQAALSAAALAFHDRDPAGVDLNGLFESTVTPFLPVGLPPDSHLHAGWTHLIGYSACYYTYAWSAVVARDFLALFLARGSLTDPELARRYEQAILAPGSSRPAMALVREFLGRELDRNSFRSWVLDDPYARRDGSAPPAVK